MSERRIPFSKPPYAALWKSSIWRIQLVSGFHLGTNLGHQTFIFGLDSLASR